MSFSTTGVADGSSPVRNKRPLKSLSDMLKGKQGRFRQNFSASVLIIQGVQLLSSVPICVCTSAVFRKRWHSSCSSPSSTISLRGKAL